MNHSNNQWEKKDANPDCFMKNSPIKCTDDCLRGIAMVHTISEDRFNYVITNSDPLRTYQGAELDELKTAINNHDCEGCVEINELGDISLAPMIPTLYSVALFKALFLFHKPKSISVYAAIAIKTNEEERVLSLKNDKGEVKFFDISDYEP